MKPGELLPLTGPVSLLAGENNGRFPRCHAMIVQGRGQTALIDTGGGESVLTPWVDKIDTVLNSHSHADHSSGNWLFDGRQILVPEDSFAVSGDIKRLSWRFMKTDRQAAGWRKLAVEEIGLRDQRPTGFFRPGQELDVGGVKLLALHAPGHTADHTCFYLPQWGAVYGGDIDLSRFGPWYANPESSIAQFRASIEMLIELRPRLLVSAHHDPLDHDIEAQLRRYRAIIDQRDELLLRFLAQTRTWDEILDQAMIYGEIARKQRLFRYFEGQMIGKHLDELLAAGRVAHERGSFWAIDG